WLCHPEVDRRAPILPWAADDGAARISPVAASAYYLRHLRDAWNTVGPGKGGDHLKLERQNVVLTVPASFDSTARELTVEAAVAAGLSHAMLLEEPQAAFYDWLYAEAADRAAVEVQDWRDDEPAAATKLRALPAGSRCLVVDVGGGTTDFSLITVGEADGEPVYERSAVGVHLLLGGDNMDVALARHVESLVSPERRLDATQWGVLVRNCRRVKERMLSDDPPDSETVAVTARGSRVVAAVKNVVLDRATVRGLALDGFFPVIPFDAVPDRTGRAGLQEFGLPYVADPAVTKHLAEFLRHHADGGAPTHILFNGGVFNAPACRRAVLDALRHWFGADWSAVVLEHRSLDEAVARGAACHAWARVGGGQRILGGAARSYYVGIAGLRDGADDEVSVVCVAPHGLQEGETVVLNEPPLELRVGEPATFPLYTSTVRPTDAAGQLLRLPPGRLGVLPALTTVLRGGKRAAGPRTVDVRLEATLTEVGVLELHLATRDGNSRWRLQFQTRASGADAVATAPRPAAGVAVGEVWSEEQLASATDLLRSAYPAQGKSKASVDDLNRLTKRLEAALGLSRTEWPLTVLRALGEVLSDGG
ncbi:MAG: Hsp70 family protein, partial [Planctomycetia bacterium]